MEAKSTRNRANKDGDKEDATRAKTERNGRQERLGQEGEGTATAPGCIRSAG